MQEQILYKEIGLGQNKYYINDYNIVKLKKKSKPTTLQLKQQTFKVYE